MPRPYPRKRIGRIQDTEDGLSEFPHVIVDQARMLAYLLERMEKSAGRLAPFYGLQASDVAVDSSGSSEDPVTVTLRHMKGLEDTGETSTFRAKYVVGCDSSGGDLVERLGDLLGR